VTITDLLGGVPGQRTEDIRFEVLDADGNLIDFLHPATLGSVSWNPSSKIARTLTGMTLDPTEATKVVAGQHRIRPKWLIPSTGDSYPLGVFLYMGGAEKELPGGTWVECSSMPDRSWQLDQKLSDMLQLTTGVLTDLFDSVAASGGITDVTGDTSTVMLGEPLTYLAKKHSRLDGLTQLADLLAFLPPHFDASGNLVRRRVPVPTDEPADHSYYSGQNSRIVADSVATSTKLAPNVYIVESTTPSGTAVSARYDVPDSAPNSRANIGFEILPDDDLVIPGLTSDSQALATATARAKRDAATATTITFASTPDPRHDCWGVVDFNGTLMLEVAWTLELGPGGKHSHTLAAQYA
jgi:hypothetical protein